MTSLILLLTLCREINYVERGLSDMTDGAALRRAEIKTRTSEEVKKEATEVYARWGLSLNDAISAIAYKPEMNADGLVVLPADWDDGDK